ncbi:MAG TPA: DNA repair exonuclease [Anaerolineae bacterium]|nr:DNA repair exonuclease [Anaerolineae bacterium]
MNHSSPVRILLIADTHLGFDLPFRPRVQRRRRGTDFFDNYERALQPAFDRDVDLVIHGGDVFFRSKVPMTLVEMAMKPLIRVAEGGVPVYIVPGNHERSRIPLHLWTAHPKLHIFDRPKTFLCAVGNTSIALSGFPYARRIRDTFHDLIEQTGVREITADAHFLCVHQVVEGAQVGTINYTFRAGQDIIRGRDIPRGFVAVLAGHIHRGQILTQDLNHLPLAAPVIYPGSIERTSFAERHEEKGYVILQLGRAACPEARLTEISFVSLPTRPMVVITLEVERLSAGDVEGWLRERFSELDPNSVVQIKPLGSVSENTLQVLSAPNLRSIAPTSMNVSLAFASRQREGSKM